MTDALYIAFLVVFVFVIIVQIAVNRTFRKYSKVSTGIGHTASEVARKILDSNGLYDVRIERVRGHLTDHYDPRSNVLRLSDSVYDNASSAAIGVAAHEVGHAIQHANKYIPIIIRGKLVPTVQFASNFSWIAIFLGILISAFSNVFGSYLLLGGAVLFSFTTLFHLVTVPCETNASRRALSALRSTGWYTEKELSSSRKVLTAAAMTYIAALASSAIQLLRLLAMALSNRNRRD